LSDKGEVELTDERIASREVANFRVLFESARYGCHL
jgi:hypothetical protein